MCGHGGIGRRVRFRFLWSQGCAGSSPVVRTKKKTIRKGCLFSCGSGLETKLHFVGKRHCVCLPLHAADAPLGNNIALLMLLRSLRSLQVLLSAPKQTKTNRNYSVRFFISWFATGLVTMQGIVCTLRVPLHAVQLAQRFASKLARLCYYARFALYKSCCPHQTRIKRTEITRFVFSYLWFATGLVTMQGIVCTLRVPLHAVQLTLHLRE